MRRKTRRSSKRPNPKIFFSSYLLCLVYVCGVCVFLLSMIVKVVDVSTVSSCNKQEKRRKFYHVIQAFLLARLLWRFESVVVVNLYRVNGTCR